MTNEQKRANLFEVWIASNSFAAMYLRYPDHELELTEAYTAYLKHQGWTAVELAQEMQRVQQNPHAPVDAQPTA